MSIENANIGQSNTGPTVTKGPVKELDQMVSGIRDPRPKLMSKKPSYVRITEFQTNYEIFRYMFNKSFVRIKESDIIYFDAVVEMMKKATEPLIFEFVEITQNEEFLEVKAKMMEYLFFSNQLWVWYDTLEKKFYLLDKLAPEDKKSKHYFDILNLKTVILPTEEPIKVMWDGRENSHFDIWFRICYRALCREQSIDKLFLLHNKRVKFFSEKTESLTPLEAELTNTDPYVISNVDNATVEPMESMDPNVLDTATKVHYQILDRDQAEAGKVANINDKEERKTTGENYKDIHAVVCRQQAVLEQLILFSKKLKRLKGVQLSFKVLGVIDKTKEEIEDENNKEGGTHNNAQQPL